MGLRVSVGLVCDTPAKRLPTTRRGPAFLELLLSYDLPEEADTFVIGPGRVSVQAM